MADRVAFDLCGGIGEAARTGSVLLEGVQAETLLDYLDRMGNQALTHRLGLILERLTSVQTVDQELIAPVARKVGPHTYLPDPHGPAEGPVGPRWRIRENIDVIGEL